MTITPHQFKGNGEFCEEIGCERPRNHRAHNTVRFRATLLDGNNRTIEQINGTVNASGGSGGGQVRFNETFKVPSDSRNASLGRLHGGFQPDWKLPLEPLDGDVARIEAIKELAKPQCSHPVKHLSGILSYTGPRILCPVHGEKEPETAESDPDTRFNLT